MSKMKISNYRLSPNEEARLIKEDKERRRKERIVQVREQAKLNAAKIRKAVKSEREKQIEILAKDILIQWQQEKEEKLHELQVEYENALHSIGQGHKGANDLDMKAEELYTQLVEDTKRAEERYEQALAKLRKDGFIKKQKENKHIESRKVAMEKEKERAARIAALPPPPPDPLRDLSNITRHPVKMTDVNALSQTHYTVDEECLVERAELQDQIDARLAAEEEAERVQTQREVDIKSHQEQIEKARLRHKAARTKEVLKQDYAQMLLDLSDLQREDVRRRQQIVAKIPKKIFQPPHRRIQDKAENERDIEQAFEDMYMAATDYTGDLTLALDPHPPPETPTATNDLDLSQADDLDETITADRPPISMPVGDLQPVMPVKPSILKDVTHVEDEKEEVIPPDKDRKPDTALKSLLNRIKSQRDDWIHKSTQALPEPEVEQTRHLDTSSSSTPVLSEHTLTSDPEGASDIIRGVQDVQDISHDHVEEDASLEPVIATNVETLLHPMEEARQLRQTAERQRKELEKHQDDRPQRAEDDLIPGSERITKTILEDTKRQQDMLRQQTELLAEKIKELEQKKHELNFKKRMTSHTTHTPQDRQRTAVASISEPTVSQERPPVTGQGRTQPMSKDQVFLDDHMRKVKAYQQKLLQRQQANYTSPHTTDDKPPTAAYSDTLADLGRRQEGYTSQQTVQPPDIRQFPQHLPQLQPELTQHQPQPVRRKPTTKETDFIARLPYDNRQQQAAEVGMNREPGSTQAGLMRDGLMQHYRDVPPPHYTDVSLHNRQQTQEDRDTSMMHPYYREVQQQQFIAVREIQQKEFVPVRSGDVREHRLPQSHDDIPEQPFVREPLQQKDTPYEVRLDRPYIGQEGPQYRGMQEQQEVHVLESDAGQDLPQYQYQRETAPQFNNRQLQLRQQLEEIRKQKQDILERQQTNVARLQEQRQLLVDQQTSMEVTPAVLLGIRQTDTSMPPDVDEREKEPEIKARAPPMTRRVMFRDDVQAHELSTIEEVDTPKSARLSYGSSHLKSPVLGASPNYHTDKTPPVRVPARQPTSTPSQIRPILKNQVYPEPLAKPQFVNYTPQDDHKPGLILSMPDPMRSVAPPIGGSESSSSIATLSSGPLTDDNTFHPDTSGIVYSPGEYYSRGQENRAIAEGSEYNKKAQQYYPLQSDFSMSSIATSGKQTDWTALKPDSSLDSPPGGDAYQDYSGVTPPLSRHAGQHEPEHLYSRIEQVNRSLQSELSQHSVESGPLNEQSDHSTASSDEPQYPITEHSLGDLVPQRESLPISDRIDLANKTLQSELSQHTLVSNDSAAEQSSSAHSLSQHPMEDSSVQFSGSQQSEVYPSQTPQWLKHEGVNVGSGSSGTSSDLSEGPLEAVTPFRLSTLIDRSQYAAGGGARSKVPESVLQSDRHVDMDHSDISEGPLQTESHTYDEDTYRPLQTESQSYDERLYKPLSPATCSASEESFVSLQPRGTSYEPTMRDVDILPAVNSDQERNKLYSYLPVGEASVSDTGSSERSIDKYDKLIEEARMLRQSQQDPATDGQYHLFSEDETGITDEPELTFMTMSSEADDRDVTLTDHGEEDDITEQSAEPSAVSESLLSFEKHEHSVEEEHPKRELTLQEAFQKKKQDTLQSMQKRQVTTSHKDESGTSLSSTLASWKQSRAVRPKKSAASSKSLKVGAVASREVKTSRDRKKEVEEMKERNSRLYSNLEEVKRSRIEKERELQKGVNRERAKEYQKNLLKRHSIQRKSDKSQVSSRKT